MKEEKVEIRRDGLTLRGFLSVPETKKFDLVVLFHGILMNCGRTDDTLMYAAFRHLTSLGLAVLRVDFNGHGESDGRMDDMSVLNEICDASAILNYARTIPGVRRIYVLGHSQGGVIAAITAGYYPDWIDRLVLMAPAATLKTDAQKGVIMEQSYDPHAIPDRLTVRGEEIGGFYFRAAQTLPIYEWASHYEGPVCLIHCEEDAIVDCAASKQFHETFKNNELHLLPGGNHSFIGKTREEGLRIAGEFLLR